MELRVSAHTTDAGETIYTDKPRGLLAVGKPQAGPVYRTTVTRWTAPRAAEIDPEGDATDAELDAALAAHPGSTETEVTYWSTSAEAEAHGRAALDAAPGARYWRAAGFEGLRRDASSVSWEIEPGRALWRVTVAVECVRAQS